MNWRYGRTKKYPVGAVWPVVVVGVGAVKSLATRKVPCSTGKNVPTALLNVAVVLDGGNCILERCWAGNIPGLRCTPRASNKSLFTSFPPSIRSSLSSHSSLSFFVLFFFALLALLLPTSSYHRSRDFSKKSSIGHRIKAPLAQTITMLLLVIFLLFYLYTVGDVAENYSLCISCGHVCAAVVCCVLIIFITICMLHPLRYRSVLFLA